MYDGSRLGYDRLPAERRRVGAFFVGRPSTSVMARSRSAATMLASASALISSLVRWYAGVPIR